MKGVEVLMIVTSCMYPTSAQLGDIPWHVSACLLVTEPLKPRKAQSTQWIKDAGLLGTCGRELGGGGCMTANCLFTKIWSLNRANENYWRHKISLSRAVIRILQ